MSDPKVSWSTLWGSLILNLITVELITELPRIDYTNYHPTVWGFEPLSPVPPDTPQGSLVLNLTHTYGCTANVSLVPISMRFIKRLALFDQDQRSLLTRVLL